MEDKILNALTVCITHTCQNKTEFKGEFFKDLDGVKIKAIWEKFFELAQNNEIVYKAVCRDISDFYDEKTNTIDFMRDEKIETSTFELYIKLLLLLIDDMTYTTDEKGRLIMGKKALTLAEMISQIRTRAFFYSNGKLAESMAYDGVQYLDTKREPRNSKSHEYTPGGAVFEQYLEAFFVATLIYIYISNIWAGLKVMPFKEKISMWVETENGSQIIWKRLSVILFDRKAVCIPVTKECFGINNKLKLRIRIFEYDKQHESKVIEIKRGEFYSDRSESSFHKSTPKTTVSDTKLETQNSELMKKCAELEEKNTKLEKYNAELKEQFQKQPALTPVGGNNHDINISDIVGIVHIRNTKNDAQCYLRINEGLNTYGTDPDNGNHHKILLGLRGIDIKPKQFEIEQKGNRLFIRDLSNGETLINEQPIDPKGAYVTENTTIRVANYLEIHISKL